MTRELVPGSMELYAIAGYGAVEIGVHRFSHPGGNDGRPLGEAKFVHLWHHVGDRLELARVISFDHRPLEKAQE